MDLVATLQLVELAPDGERKAIEVQIGRPHWDERGSWACPVLVTSISDKVREIHGEDSMQALCLAVQFVRSMLHSVITRGSRLVHTDEDMDFHPEVYFESFGQPGAPPTGGPAPPPAKPRMTGGLPSVS
jgi:hypothetical protein